MSKRFVYYGAGVAGGIDTDAQAFLNATGIVDETIVNAIDTLVKDLKAQNLWSKFRYIYPFVGGTATTNKFNLKDPRDLDVAFRLEFFGGIIHSDGFNPNGTNGYANSFCSPNGNITLNSEHLYLTSNTNNTATVSVTIDVGALTDISKASFLGIKNAGNIDSRLNSNRIQTPNSNSIGSFCATKNGNTDLKLYKNTNLEITATSAGTLSSLWLFLGTLTRVNASFPNKSAPGNNYSNQNYTFATYGDGLSDTDVSNLTTIEQNFNTTLGR